MTRASIAGIALSLLTLTGCGEAPPSGGETPEEHQALEWDDPVSREEGVGNWITECSHPQLVNSITAANVSGLPADGCPVIPICVNMSERGFEEADGRMLFSVDPRVLIHEDFRGVLEIQFPFAPLYGTPYMEYQVNLVDGFGHIQQSARLSNGPAGNNACLLTEDPEGFYVCSEHVGAVIFENCRPSQPDFNLIQYTYPPWIVEVIELSDVPGRMLPRARGITYLIREDGLEALPPPTTIDAVWDPLAGDAGGIRVSWSPVEGADRYAVITAAGPERYLFDDIGYLIAEHYWAASTGPWFGDERYVEGTEAVITELDESMGEDGVLAAWVYVAAQGPEPTRLRGLPSRQIPVTNGYTCLLDDGGAVLGPAPQLAGCAWNIAPGTVGGCSGIGLGTLPSDVRIFDGLMDPELLYSWSDEQFTFRFPWDPWEAETRVTVSTPEGWTTSAAASSNYAGYRVFEVVPNHGAPGDEFVVYGETLWDHMRWQLRRWVGTGIELEVVDHDAAGESWARLRIPDPLPPDAPPMHESLQIVADAHGGTTSAGHQFTLHDADTADEVLLVFQNWLVDVPQRGWLDAVADTGGAPAFAWSDYPVLEPRYGGPPRQLAREFDLVFWSTWELVMGTLSGRDVVTIWDLLGRGGALWLEGTHVVSEHQGTDFLRDLLHADLAAAVECTGTVSAPPGSPLAGWITAPIPLECAYDAIDTIDPLDGEVLLALDPGGEPVMVGYGNQVVVSSLVLTDIDDVVAPDAPAAVVDAVMRYTGVLP